MDPIQLRQQLRRRSAGRVAEEVVTTKEDVAAKAKKKTKAYGERRYWEARYDDEDVTTDYDWLCDWDALAPVFERNVGGPGARSVLHTGCGNSPLGFELARAGYCDRCVNVDYSAAVVDRMEAAYPSVERGPAPEANALGRIDVVFLRALETPSPSFRPDESSERARAERFVGGTRATARTWTTRTSSSTSWWTRARSTRWRATTT